MTGEPVQRDHPQRGAVNATTTATTTDGATVTRQCARCRLHFPVEAGTHPMELPSGWWVCPTCATRSCRVDAGARIRPANDPVVRHDCAASATAENRRQREESRCPTNPHNAPLVRRPASR